jgi:hypothetical protein
MSDWPKDTIGWFDESARHWCWKHEPKEYDGELEPLLASDGWAFGAGACVECDAIIGDTLPPGVTR